jgi:site-specific recombinase XerD
MNEIAEYKIELPEVKKHELDMPTICRMAQSDFEIMNKFLFRVDLKRRFKLSDNTISYYSKEFRRLACYCNLVRMGFQNLTDTEVTGYVEFLTNPPDILIGEKRFPVKHKDWKPFHKRELSASSLKQAIKPITSLWTYMQKNGYVQRNPWAELSLTTDESRNEQQLRRLRVIPKEALLTTLKWLDDAKGKSNYDQRRIARCRWLFCLYMFSGTRLSDVIINSAEAFEKIDGYWVFNHVSKGDATHSTPVPNMLINEFHQYRLSVNRVPSYKGDLVYSLTGNHGLTDRSTIHGEMKYLFGEAAKYAAEIGDYSSARKLELASTHWLKHSFVSLALDVSDGNIRLVTDLARHADWKTTKAYDHTSIKDGAKVTNDMAKALGQNQS